MNPSAAAMTMASTTTVTHGSGTLPRNAAKRTNGSCAGSVSVVDMVDMVHLVDSVGSCRV